MDALFSSHMSRLKLADLTSTMGALVLGVGLGALLADALNGLAYGALILGFLLHGTGMWDKHRLEVASNLAAPAWFGALYWICWTLLALLWLWFVVRGLVS